MITNSHTLEHQLRTIQGALRGEQIEAVPISKKDTPFERYYLEESPTWDWGTMYYRTKENITSFANRLFLNAPVIDITQSYKCVPFAYANKASAPCEQGSFSSSEKAAYWSRYRLPTVTEAPVNTWLVPWDEEPLSIENKRCIMKYKTAEGVKTDIYVRGLVNWSDIISIAIWEN